MVLAMRPIAETPRTRAVGRYRGRSPHYGCVKCIESIDLVRACVVRVANWREVVREGSATLYVTTDIGALGGRR